MNCTEWQYSKQDIDVAQKVWGDNLSVLALKGKTKKAKPPPVVSDFVKVP